MTMDHNIHKSLRRKHRNRYPRRPKPPQAESSESESESESGPPEQESLVENDGDMMGDIRDNSLGPIGGLNDGLDDGSGDGLENLISDTSDENESDSDDANDDDIQLLFSIDEEESGDNGNEMDEDENSMDGEKQFPLDDAASWELERLQALTGITSPRRVC